MYDTIIVGAGLAGACAALYLAERESVLVLDAGSGPSEASRAAAGMVSPIMGRRATPVWQLEEAMEAFTTTLDRTDAAHLFNRSGVVRPAVSEEEIVRFKQAARTYPGHGVWLSPAEATERYPEVSAPRGALLSMTGGSLSVPQMIDSALKRATASSAELRQNVAATTFGERDGGIFVVTSEGTRIGGRRLLFCVGPGYQHFAALRRLKLHPVKGQTLRLRRPANLGNLPCVAARASVAPDGDFLVVGSSYEHTFSDLDPSEEQTNIILKRAKAVVPALEEAGLIEVTVGVRVTVPGIRLPMVGPVPGFRNVWIFSGLGSKGVLMAPLIASRLKEYFRNPESIPEAVRVS